MRATASYRKRPVFVQPDFARRSRREEFVSSILSVLSNLWLPLSIALVTFTCYLPALQVGFLSDDFFYHAMFRWGWRDFVHKLALIHHGELQFPFLRPATIISFKLDYWLWGADPVGFHATNLFIHSGNAVLVFYLFRNLGLNLFLSTVGSLLFGTYPAGPEAVVWVSGRFDLLALSWLLVSLLLWSRGRYEMNNRLLALSAVAFFIAITAKETAAAGLLAFPLLDLLIHMETRRHWGQGTGFHWKWYLVASAILLSVLAFRLWLYGDVGGYYDEHLKSAYLASGFSEFHRNLMQDIRKLFSPLNVEYAENWESLPAAFFVIEVMLHALILVMVLVIVATLAAGATLIFPVRLLRRVDETALFRIPLGALWILFFLLPVAPLARVSDSLDFSRFLYIPSVGLAMVITSLLQMGMAGRELVKRAAIIVAVLIVISFVAVLRLNQAAWLEAGEVAGRIHAAMAANLSDLPDNSRIYLVNPPLLYKGAHCAPLDYGGYLEFAYGTKGVSTEIVRMEPEEVDQWWERMSESCNRTGQAFVWDDERKVIKVLPRIEPGDPDTEALGEFLRSGPS